MHTLHGVYAYKLCGRKWGTGNHKYEACLKPILSRSLKLDGAMLSIPDVDLGVQDFTIPHGAWNMDVV